MNCHVSLLGSESQFSLIFILFIVTNENIPDSLLKISLACLQRIYQLFYRISKNFKEFLILGPYSVLSGAKTKE